MPIRLAEKRSGTALCMTVNVADLMGLGKSRGEIRTRFAADIIATTANPLENIVALRKVNFVMKDGKVVRDSRATAPH